MVNYYTVGRNDLKDTMGDTEHIYIERWFIKDVNGHTVDAPIYNEEYARDLCYLLNKARNERYQTV